jgi:pimeloyl-ACP methyl ester carboxylesterase
MCAERAGLPPILIVQAGPGFPLLNEVPKFQHRLNLEHDFLVTYWDQRGCGAAPPDDARAGSLQRLVDDTCRVVQHLHAETKQPVVLLGISLGGTTALRAVERTLPFVKAVVAISPDGHTGMSDASVDRFLQEQSRRSGRRVRRRVETLGRPPYVDVSRFQQRARLLADLGSIERGRTFNALLGETLMSLVRTYGVPGTVNALRNMTLGQRRLLPQVVTLDLLTRPPRVGVPVHYLFGEQDALTPPAIVEQLPAAVRAPISRTVVVPNAGHMVHFDQPDTVRAALISATRQR